MLFLGSHAVNMGNVVMADAANMGLFTPYARRHNPFTDIYSTGNAGHRPRLIIIWP